MPEKTLQLALFDLDNTLLAGDSDFEWGRFLIGLGVLDEELHLARNTQFYEDYKQGTLDIHAFLEFQLKPLSAHPREQLNTWHAQFMAEVIRPMMTAQARALVEKHRASGDLMVVITATNSFVTAPIAREFGIDHLIATTPEEVNGEYTGRVSGVPSFKEGKITRLLQWLDSRGQTLQSFEASWFYSDSHNDLPLMQRVDHPVAVNPDPVLRSHAEERGWPVISLRQ
ncbi:haloacid dehalogenase-like hydrolase [mine drainage metagenome]|uniref:Haloacid dehalogenase-like hydrolase n=1 Tax=mine drainage metagenome TaxID=410659 RepID=A0A1J5QTZ6_9ZZZZ